MIPSLKPIGREVTQIITKCIRDFYLGNPLPGKPTLKDISSFNLANLAKPTKEKATRGIFQWIY
jgi:hypothetical protein